MELTMAGALNAALRDSMRADDSVVVYGEDVGRLGGVFASPTGCRRRSARLGASTRPLLRQGSPGRRSAWRCTGSARRRDAVRRLLLPGAQPGDQPCRQVPQPHPRHVGLPLVIRIPYGGGIGAVEHHSESPEAYYAHTAGLKVVSPGTPSDAYALLRASIASDDPVIFLEPKRRYWLKEDLDLPVTRRADR